MLIEAIPDNRPKMENDRKRKRVMVCIQRYLPGYKSGGPVRAVANMIEELGERFDFFVITRDRDATDSEPYPGVASNHWYRVGKAQVFYCSTVTRAKVRRVFQEVRPDVISLNSFQEHFTRIVVMLRKAGELGNTPVLLAPRGEFSPGAMEIKPTKKALYRYATRMAGFHDNLHWQVSAPLEKEELLRAAPARSLHPGNIHIVSEVTDAALPDGPHAAKAAGSLKLAFISRISEKKNLGFALEVLQQVKGRVEFDIFGPVADWDAAYWEQCRQRLAKLPDNIIAQYHGSLDHSEVPRQLRNHHFFILPTRGENYCHAAVESFINGTPVILSDKTPWIELRQARAGFDIPLDNMESWMKIVQECVDLDQESYARYLQGTLAYSARFSLNKAAQEHIAMFETAFSSRT